MTSARPFRHVCRFCARCLRHDKFLNTPLGISKVREVKSPHGMRIYGITEVLVGASIRCSRLRAGWGGFVQNPLRGGQVAPGTHDALIILMSHAMRRGVSSHCDGGPRGSEKCLQLGTWESITRYSTGRSCEEDSAGRLLQSRGGAIPDSPTNPSRSWRHAF